MTSQKDNLLLANKNLLLMREYNNRPCVPQLKKFLSPIKKQINSNKKKPLPFIDDSLRKILPEIIYNSISDISLLKGVLCITSNNQTWKSQAEMFHKKSLLVSLQTSLPKNIIIRKISFR